MQIYLTQLKVRFKDPDSRFGELGEVDAFCWVKALDQSAAAYIATFEVERDGWVILGISQSPIPIVLDNFRGNKWEVEQLSKAEEFGRSIMYVAVDDKAKETTVEELDTHEYGDIGAYHRTRNKLAKIGKCLHFNAGDECTSVIRAHSVQKSQLLSVISKNNHIYALANKVENDGGVKIQKKSIYKFSTFRGFCQYHDNEIFEPIDNKPFHLELEQASLYAYRSICRELYVKNNSLHLFLDQLAKLSSNGKLRQYLSDLIEGTQNGLETLSTKKVTFDRLLKTKQLDQLKYVVFESESKPNISFSGLLYPDFDFQGRRLQDLAVSSFEFSLITFCSAPTDNGWAALFVWHENDDEVCFRFIESLKEAVRAGKTIEDSIFRLVILTCDNVAFSPNWWEALDSSQQDAVREAMRIGGEALVPVKEDYLVSGLEGLVKWDFQKVYSSY
ncbi:hypothetical protein [Idiomarina abyssalis]|uniref:hypothetical protein n=1 Tax=Idiomarina abyssalis TaxID=86102 RepID=UPI003A8F644D